MIVSIVGARPQFVKAAVVSSALKRQGLSELIVHTGQHYDKNMSDVFWEELGIPKFSVNLDSGSGTQGAQTANIIQRLESYMLSLEENPRCLILYGDTNSTLAGSIVAAKMNIPIVHIEAGLRSFNKLMPEEINRIVTDRLSTLLFCSSELGVQQLASEGISEKVFNCGDVMYDAVLTYTPSAEGKFAKFLKRPTLPEKFSLLTLHRPSNTDDPMRLVQIFSAIEKINDLVFWPLHPRMKSRLADILVPPNVCITEPLSYFEMLDAISHSQRVITDSGGLQKEAYWLKTPCITLRNETEWIETLHNNWNMLWNSDSTGDFVDAYTIEVEKSSWKTLYGDGTASKQIASIISKSFY